MYMTEDDLIEEITKLESEVSWQEALVEAAHEEIKQLQGYVHDVRIAAGVEELESLIPIVKNHRILAEKRSTS